MTTHDEKGTGVGRRPCVVMLDPQHDFLASGGRLPIEQDQVPSLVWAVNGLGARALAHGWPVFRVGNHFDPRSRVRNMLRRGAAIDGDPGCVWDERVETRPTDAYVKKSAPSAFTAPGFADRLRAWSVDHLIVTGVMASACVSATCTDAVGRGFRVTVMADAVGDRSTRARSRSLEGLGRQGIEVVTLESFPL